MPFVDAKITTRLTDQEQESVKAGIANAVEVFGKGESWLMVGIDDDYDLWLGGNKLEKGAYVSVSLIGDTPDEGCQEFTRRMCELLSEQLGISGDSVYITYHPMMRTRWGWNGSTF